MLGYLINIFWLHANTAKQIAILGAVSLSGSYVLWFVSAFVLNTLRVPWLLDAESIDLINTQESRAEAAERELAEINAAKHKHDLFARLMQQGVDFSRQLAECQTDAQFISWNRHATEWIKSVQQAMRDMGFPTDAVEFARAGEYADLDLDYSAGRTAVEQQKRALVFEKHQENLADFVQRRLS